MQRRARGREQERRVNQRQTATSVEVGVLEQSRDGASVESRSRWPVGRPVPRPGNRSEMRSARQPSGGAGPAWEGGPAAGAFVTRGPPRSTEAFDLVVVVRIPLQELTTLGYVDRYLRTDERIRWPKAVSVPPSESEMASVLAGTRVHDPFPGSGSGWAGWPTTAAGSAPAPRRRGSHERTAVGAGAGSAARDAGTARLRARRHRHVRSSAVADRTRAARLVATGRGHRWCAVRPLDHEPTRGALRPTGHPGQRVHAGHVPPRPGHRDLRLA